MSILYFQMKIHSFYPGKGGGEEKDVFGPEGPKNMKNNGYQQFFLPIFDIQKAFESSFQIKFNMP